MKNRTLLLVFLLLLPLSLSAGIRLSRIELPEKAIQGEPVEVRYVMNISGSWIFQGPRNEAEGIRLLKRSHTKKQLPGYIQQVTITYQVLCTAAGPVEFPAIQFRTDKGLETVPGATLQVAPHPEYGEAWRAARDFLLQQGEDCRNLAWQLSNRGVHAFYDPSRDIFAWVRRSEIVAYGTGNYAWDQEENDYTIEYLFEAYCSGRYIEIPSGTVAPLLGEIAYNQNGKYCEGFPKVPFQGRDSTCIAGCGPVALAQVLQYYGPSVRPAGKGQLMVDGAAPIQVNIQGADWSSLKVNEQLYLSAASLQAELSPTGSISSLISFPYALTENWGFSPTFRYRRDFPLVKLAEWLHTELNAGRPVFLATKDHVLVCDGCKDGFLHLNFGWGGVCNGWYRLPEDAYFPECLTGVMPMRPEEDYALEVMVKKAGTLAAAIPADRASEVTRLKVSGKIRGEDIALLRQMATEGRLMELDLSDARIVNGPLLQAQPYAELDASGMTFTSQYSTLFGTIPGTEKEWEIDAMTDEMWKDMSRLGLTSGPGFSLVRDENGVRIRYYSQDDTVGPRMFSGCDRLRTLRLPRTITAIKENAFWYCVCLEHLYLPQGPVSCSKQAFTGTLPFLQIHKEQVY